jgi:hypothetical protein
MSLCIPTRSHLGLARLQTRGETRGKRVRGHIAQRGLECSDGHHFWLGLSAVVVVKFESSGCDDRGHP